MEGQLSTWHVYVGIFLHTVLFVGIEGTNITLNQNPIFRCFLEYKTASVTKVSNFDCKIFVQSRDTVTNLKLEMCLH